MSEQRAGVQDCLSPQEVPEEPQRAASVFGARLDQSHTVGHVPCPKCAHQIPYRLSQVGQHVSCPSCGESAVRIGESLLVEAGVERQAHIDTPYLVLVVKKPGLSRRTFVAIVMLALAAFSLAAGLVLTSSRSLALMEGWMDWRAVETAEAKAPTGTAQADTSELPLEAPDVTLEAIERLLENDDPRAALAQARLWQQILRDYRVAESDPRLLRLAEIIAHLTERLKAPPAPPPAFIKEFKTAIEALRQAVIAEDLSAGKVALESAQTLLDEHPKELAIFGRSFLALKRRFEHLVLEKEGRVEIGRQLAEAERLISADQPTEAAECLAKSMYLALRTALDDAEFQERDATVRRLERELRYSRGKRAVREAEDCQTAGDLTARDIQMKLASALLPDLEASRVADLLLRAKKLESQKIASPVRSPLGREIAFRSAYEEALRYYGRREALVELAERCVAAERLFREASGLDADRLAKVTDLILSSLESEVGDLLSLASRGPEAAAGLALARAALEAATPWKSTARWSAVDSALKSKGGEIAATALDDAQAKYREGDLALALKLIGPALTLGDAGLKTNAKKLQKDWEVELQKRNSLAAQEDAWNEMRALFLEKKAVDVWHRLDQFEKQFPDSPRLAQLKKVREDVRATVEADVEKLFKEVTRHYQGQDWPRFRESAERLGITLLTEEHKKRYELVRTALSNMDEEAEDIFRKSSSIKLINDKEVVNLLAALDEVLRRNPNHAEALKRQEEARKRAEQIAGALLLSARNAGPKNKAYPDYLKRVLLLDPDGKLGAEAKELLKKTE